VLKFYDINLSSSLEAKNDNKDMWRVYLELFTDSAEQKEKFSPGRGDLWDLALTTYFLMTGGEHLTRELADPFLDYYKMLKELHKWFSKPQINSKLDRMPGPIHDFIVSLLRIDSEKIFESWDNVLETIATLETNCI
jgi:hypothetical protein